MVIVADNLRPGGAIKGISGTLRMEELASVVAILRVSMW
jgi:hypothetical protein